MTTINSKNVAGNVFNVFFDGGNNPKDGNYGSWSVVWNGFNRQTSRESYNHKIGPKTNNTAEWWALIEALKWLQTVKDLRPLSRVAIHGDSRLVLFQLSGRYRCKQPHLKPLRDTALRLLEGFKGFDVVWRPRQESVKRFGH